MSFSKNCVSISLGLLGYDNASYNNAETILSMLYVTRHSSAANALRDGIDWPRERGFGPGVGEDGGKTYLLGMLESIVALSLHYYYLWYEVSS